jgi:hypothetical protein
VFITPAMPTSNLSFSIRIARSHSDLLEACRVRSESYGHHLPELGLRFAAPEPLDHSPGTVVLIARDHLTGRGLGTARIQTNRGTALQLEASVDLPGEYAAHARAEITRLAVAAGADAQVKWCLMKAAYLYCLAAQVRWMVIGARSDALIRNYRALGFTDVLPGGARVPLAHAGNMPHQLLAFDVTAAERRWQQAGHRLYDFMVGTFHPDLQLFRADALPALPRPAGRRGHRPLHRTWQAARPARTPAGARPEAQAATAA